MKDFSKKKNLAILQIVTVLHNCVVIFFWSSGIMECTCMLFTFENGVPLLRYGASVVWHHSLLLMNCFNKTEAAVYSCRLCFLRAFPFISYIYSTFYPFRSFSYFPDVIKTVDFMHAPNLETSENCNTSWLRRTVSIVFHKGWEKAGKSLTKTF